MNTQLHIFWFAVVLLGFTPWASVLQAQQPLLNESFDDPALPGWEHSPGVAVVDGVLRIEPGGYAHHPLDWSEMPTLDLTLNVCVRLLGEGPLVVSYSVSDAGRYHAILGSHFLSLQREEDGGAIDLRTVYLDTMQIGEWVQLSVSTNDNNHTVDLGGEIALTVIDPNPLPPGGVSLEQVGSQIAEVDDLSVIARESLLPAYQAETWVNLGGPPGGIGYDIRFNFSDPNIWYVTDTCGGFHISTDRGLTWRQSNDGIHVDPFGCYHVFCVTVDPHDPNTIWAGTRDFGYIYKSTNGGASWKDPSDGSVGGEGYAFRGFTVDPRSSDIVYAMAEVRDWLFRQEGELSEYDLMDRDWSGGRIFKTTDGGSTWTMIWQGPALARYLWINPDNPDELYASTGIFDRQALDYPIEDFHAQNCGGVGILKSTDGGQTWDVLGFEKGLTNLYIGSLYMHPEDPQTLLAGGGSDICPAGSGSSGDEVPRQGGVYLTNDGGTTWTPVVQDDIITSVEFCDTHPEVAFAGSRHRIYRSDDGGQTWQAFGHPERRTWGPEGLNPGTPIDIQTDPDDCNRILINNYDGGNFVSTDGGETWSDASQGYTGAAVWGIHIHPDNPMKVTVGSGIAPYVSEDGGFTWRGLSNGQIERGANALVGDPSNPEHILVQHGAQALPLPGVFETFDGGEYWAQVFGWHGPESSFNRFADFAFAPSNPKIVYGATITMGEWPDFPPDSPHKGNGIYRSTDGGTTWQAPTDTSITEIGFWALAVSPSDANTVYAGAFYNHGIFKSVDGGLTWSPINQGLPELIGHYSAIAVDPRDNGVIYAGGSVGLFKSPNAGDSWTRLAAGLDPAANVSSIVFDLTNPDVVYVGTYNLGVYYSDNSGGQFHPLNQGLELGESLHLRILKLALSRDGTVLYAGTGGMGLYRLGTPGP